VLCLNNNETPTKDWWSGSSDRAPCEALNSSTSTPPPKKRERERKEKKNSNFKKIA
jgi:hypothetical protein